MLRRHLTLIPFSAFKTQPITIVRDPFWRCLGHGEGVGDIPSLKDESDLLWSRIIFLKHLLYERMKEIGIKKEIMKKESNHSLVRV